MNEWRVPRHWMRLSWTSIVCDNNSRAVPCIIACSCVLSASHHSASTCKPAMHVCSSSISQRGGASVVDDQAPGAPFDVDCLQEGLPARVWSNFMRRAACMVMPMCGQIPCCGAPASRGGGTALAACVASGGCPIGVDRRSLGAYPLAVGPHEKWLSSGMGPSSLSVAADTRCVHASSRIDVCD